jgi:polyisoprenoid-binding protein YceI
MKRAVLFAYAVAALAAAAHADDYALDASHTSVIFGVKHMEYSYTYGRFNKVSGSYTLDPANPAGAKFQLVIDASSVDTNDVTRDKHLQGPDFFDSGQFPVISFESKKVGPAPGADASMWLVEGDLTIHGVTRPVQLQLKKVGEGKGMQGDHRTGFLCVTKVLRSEFGMTQNIPMVGDEVAVTISFEGTRQEAGAGTTGAKPAKATERLAAK